MSLAKDIMTPNPIVLESSMDILEAIKIFTEKKFSSVPVMTTLGEVSGQLTELGMVKALVLHQLQPDKFKKLQHCESLFEPAEFVEPGDPISTVIKAIIKSTSRRVLVRADGRKILGIISPKDMLRALLAGKTEAQVIQAEMDKTAPK